MNTYRTGIYEESIKEGHPKCPLCGSYSIRYTADWQAKKNFTSRKLVCTDCNNAFVEEYKFAAINLVDALVRVTTHSCTRLFGDHALSLAVQETISMMRGVLISRKALLGFLSALAEKAKEEFNRHSAIKYEFGILDEQSCFSLLIVNPEDTKSMKMKTDSSTWLLCRYEIVKNDIDS